MNCSDNIFKLLFLWIESEGVGDTEIDKRWTRNILKIHNNCYRNNGTSVRKIRRNKYICLNTFPGDCPPLDRAWALIVLTINLALTGLVECTLSEIQMGTQLFII